MKNRKFTFTSESVSHGHPDKIADFISDSILDACLGVDENARVACETLIKNNDVVLAGEITCRDFHHLDIREIVQCAVATCAGQFAGERYVPNPMGLTITDLTGTQSPDIAQGVDKPTQGAGDQGMMFGFACRDTPELMPIPIMLAHWLLQETDVLNVEAGILRPDGKSQISVEYENGRPSAVSAIVLSLQHGEDVPLEKVKDLGMDAIKRSIPGWLMREDTKIFINPTGRFVEGGPFADCGLTGRKIMVDTYGGMGRHGGGAFSGKDASKVDRSGAYFARYVAKNIVSANLADTCEVQVSYAIGEADPVSILVDTFGTNRTPEEKIEKAVKEVFSFRPADIIRVLDLRRPRYRETTMYGHFGKDNLAWETPDRVKDLQGMAF